MAVTGCDKPTANGKADASNAAKPTGKLTLLNVSYDPTRELYNDVNAAFATVWRAEQGQEVEIRNTHGGSGKQALSLIHI